MNLCKWSIVTTHKESTYSKSVLRTNNHVCIFIRFLIDGIRKGLEMENVDKNTMCKISYTHLTGVSAFLKKVNSNGLNGTWKQLSE